VVLAFLAGWYFNDNTNEIIPSTVESEVVKTEKEISGEESIQGFANSNNQKELQNEAENQQVIEVTENNSFKRTSLNKNTITKTKETEIPVFTSFEKTRMKMLDRIEVLFKPEQAELFLAKNTFTESANRYTETEKNRIAQNVKTSNLSAKNKANWKMGMHLSPGYSSNVSSHSESYAQNMTYSGSSGNGNLGGGLSIQYKTGKRLSIESGIYYAQNGQKSNNSSELFARSSNMDLAFSADEKSYFNTAVNVANGQMEMNSTAGVIQFSGTPDRVEVAADLESSSEYSNILLTEGEFSQKFDFIEIPILLRLNVVDAKIDVEIVGGLNAGLLVANNAFMENEFGLQNIGETQDISTLNLSGTFGIGINYALGKNVSLAVEPRMNYYLNSINKNSGVDYRPYRIGVFTGLYYEF
ncbi:MAG: outer membrane beta-barrel protein, partial [Prolixibacteraceae bacterium]|nr:outer membrane beta-barrel protein [Prolixibacteraceae bacterium]